jgi:cobalt-zinc-cadmium efflux system membrane fusion protein
VQSNDVSGAYQVYRKAENDERLARIQLERAQLLYDKGAIAKSALEQADETELRMRRPIWMPHRTLCTLLVSTKITLGDRRHCRTHIGRDHRPASHQRIGRARLGSPNPFTISDLSYVWIICDVYENDLDAVHPGEYVDIRLNAFPSHVFKGRIDNILPILDPNLRTAKVRIEVANPGMMRVGMFVTATFYGKQPETHAAVPASAILHLHDREWVYTSVRTGHFKRLEVVTGSTLPDNMQEVVSGIKPGDQVVSNALALQNTLEQ